MGPLVYLRVVWQYKWIVIPLVILLAGAGYLKNRSHPPVYEAKAKILVFFKDKGLNTGFASITTTPAIIKASDYAELAKSPVILDETAARLAQITDAQRFERAQIKARLTVLTLPMTNVLEIRFRATEPRQAMNVVNTLVSVLADKSKEFLRSGYMASLEAVQDELLNWRQRLAKTKEPRARASIERLIEGLQEKEIELRITAAATIGELEIMESAVEPTVPLRSNALLIAGVSGIWGLIIGTGLAFALEYRRAAWKDLARR